MRDDTDQLPAGVADGPYDGGPVPSLKEIQIGAVCPAGGGQVVFAVKSRVDQAHAGMIDDIPPAAAKVDIFRCGIGIGLFKQLLDPGKVHVDQKDSLLGKAPAV